MAQLKQIQDLPGLCTAVLSSFWDKWDNSRQADFYTYCQTVLSYINVSPSVVYTSLKYVQTYAQSSTPPPTYGAERSLFLTALLLAYKFVEDCGTVDSNYWSRASMIPVPELVKMEIDFLHQLKHMLHVHDTVFAEWVAQCNSIHDQSVYAGYPAGVYYYPCYRQADSFLMTSHTFGYPVYNSSYYNYCTPQYMYYDPNEWKIRRYSDNSTNSSLSSYNVDMDAPPSYVPNDYMYHIAPTAAYSSM